MSGRDYSLSEFLDWVYKLDDSYKVFLFSIINALFYFILMATGQSIDPDSIKELVLGSFIESLGNPVLTAIWVNVARPILFIAGIVQLGISIYAIWKFKILGLIIASTGFAGLFMLLSTTRFDLPREVVYLSLAMVAASYLLARWKSNLRFDNEGRVIYE